MGSSSYSGGGGKDETNYTGQALASIGTAAYGGISTVATGVGSVAAGVGSFVGGYIGWKKSPQKDPSMMGYSDSSSSYGGGGGYGSYYNPPASGSLSSQDTYSSSLNKPTTTT